MIHQLSQLITQPTRICENIDEKVQYLSDALLRVLDIHVPYRWYRFTKPPAPWLTDDIKVLADARDAARSEFNVTKSADSWNRYKTLRNLSTEAVRKAKKEFFRK
nr:unnamed protein product [Callosobruchus analis]